MGLIGLIRTLTPRTHDKQANKGMKPCTPPLATICGCVASTGSIPKVGRSVYTITTGKKNWPNTMYNTMGEIHIEPFRNLLYIPEWTGSTYGLRGKFIPMRTYVHTCLSGDDYTHNFINHQYLYRPYTSIHWGGENFLFPIKLKSEGRFHRIMNYSLPVPPVHVLAQRGEALNKHCKIKLSKSIDNCRHLQRPNLLQPYQRAGLLFLPICAWLTLKGLHQSHDQMICVWLTTRGIHHSPGDLVLWAN